MENLGTIKEIVSDKNSSIAEMLIVSDDTNNRNDNDVQIN